MRKNRLIALLLTVCLAVGMMACGGDKTPASSEQPSSQAPSTESQQPSSEPVNDKPFKGAKITVYGFNEKYADEAQMTGSGWLWLASAAMHEWANANEATVEFVTTGTVDVISAAVNANQGPDMYYGYGTFPNYANIGLLKALDEEEYATLAKAVGSEKWLNMLSFKGNSYGVVFPSNGHIVVSYNRTMFENYGVKTPKEYFLEGNWTWDTFVEVCKEVTKDTNGDGKNDTYGIGYVTLNYLAPYVSEGEDGKLTSTLDTEMSRNYLDLVYNGIKDGYIANIAQAKANAWTVKKDSADGLAMMYIMDNELYNIDHIHKIRDDGDVMEPVPLPIYKKDDASTYQAYTNNIYMGILKATDNAEACVSMLSYVMDCVQKWVSDMSFGGIKTEAKGLQGTCSFSKKYLELFTAYLETMKPKYDIEQYDAEYIAKIKTYIEGFDMQAAKTYAGVTKPFNSNTSGVFKGIFNVPPATSVAQFNPVLQGQLDTYNDLYIH